MWNKTASPSQTDGSIVFARWRHWHHLANTIELVLLLAQPSLQPKLQIDWFSHFCTAHGRKSLYFAMGDSFPKIALFMGELDPHPIHDSLSQTDPTVQATSRSVQLFSHRWPQSVPILHNAMPLSLLKLPLPNGGIWTLIYYMVPWVHLSPQPKLRLDRFSRFCRAH